MPDVPLFYFISTGLVSLTRYHVMCCRNRVPLLSTVLLEKLVVVNQIYKFTVFFPSLKFIPSLRFITSISTISHVLLSQVMWIQIMRSRLIYLRPLKYPSSTVSFSNLSIYFTFPHRKPVCIFLLPHSLPPWVDHHNNIFITSIGFNYLIWV